MKTRFWLVLAALGHITTAQAESPPIKVGFISTLSGSSSLLGIEIQDGFNLALKETGNTLGGRPVEVIVGDDQASPDVAKQLADKMVKRDHVNFITGIVYSQVLMAVVPTLFAAKTFYISTGAGPSALAGAQCSPYFFGLSWQNDGQSEAMGHYLTERGYKNVFILAPNIIGGKENLEGFKRDFKGTIAKEVYSKFGELDYAAEIAQIRQSKPDAVYFFLPGGMGVNFIKQYVASGLSKEIPYFAPGYSADQDTIQAVGEPMIGLQNSSHWAWDLDNPANKKFVSSFIAAYKRIPSVYAFQGYDAARLLDRAVADVNGDVTDQSAMQKAIAAARFESVRGDFKFNSNQFPINSFYLRVVEKDPQGQVTNRMTGKIFDAHSDSYVGSCNMKHL